MKFLLVANFKMNKTISDLEDYAKKINNFENKNSLLELVIAPSYTWIWFLSWKLNLKKIKLSAQNMYFENNWAFSWEISWEMLKDLNCSYVILWHSERRENFWETNEIINKKIISAIKNNIRPILCIWENLETKDNWKTKIFLKKQILESAKNIDLNNIDIAYEPIWAIWTGKSANNKYIEDVHNFISEIIWKNIKNRILYWWSVSVENSKEISTIKNVDWLLVWSTTLKPENFIKIAKLI